MAFKMTLILVATSVVYHVAVASDESVGAKVAAYDNTTKFFRNENSLKMVKKFQEVFGNETLENVAEKFKKMFGKKELAATRQKNNPKAGQIRLGVKSLRKNRIFNKIDESQKIARFLNEGNLSDVTIRAGAKTYKLHRSGCIPISSENSELALDVDEKSFDLIVDFIYFDKIPEFESSSKAVITQLLKAAIILKSKLVIEKCGDPWLEKFREELNAEDIIELLNSTVGNNLHSENWITNEVRRFFQRLNTNEFYSKPILFLWQLCEAAGFERLSSDFRNYLMSAIDFNNMKYENFLSVFDAICEANVTGKYSDMYIACLCKLVVAPRPELSVESHLLSVSCEVLEKLLASEYFIISDTQKIVDICSKWIAHDVKNRYRLIPRIVLAINRNNSTDCSDFESNIPADLSNCSQKTVEEDLWKLLNLNCLISRDLGSIKTVWDFKSRPMFILPKNVDQETRMPEKVCVVDSDLNEMASLNFLLSHYDVAPKWDCLMDPKLSATLIGDTLFILCDIRNVFNVYAYNFSSKNMNILGSAPRSMYYPKDTLLNCNNQLFWCFDDGRVMKYSIELNRWLQLYFEPERRNYGPYGSDRNKLFRYREHTLQTFDFEKSSWTHLTDLPPSYFGAPDHLTNFHNGFALVNPPLFPDKILLFHLDTQSWDVIPRPYYFPTHGWFSLFNVELAPYGKDLLYVHANGIAQLSPPSRIWQIKELSSRDLEFEGIVAIHSASYVVP